MNGESVSHESSVSIASSRITGAVRKLKPSYGFIAGDNGKDYFFHWTAMDKNGKNFRELSIQDRVSFLIAESPDGERAVAVRLVS